MLDVLVVPSFFHHFKPSLYQDQKPLGTVVPTVFHFESILITIIISIKTTTTKKKNKKKQNMFMYIGSEKQKDYNFVPTSLFCD